MITALEWLSRVHAQLDLAASVDKVILLQIRAASSCVRKPQKNSGWLYATLGPIVTMLNVRNTSQRNSNEAALAAMKAVLDQSKRPVAFETVTFELDEDSPLSWHLSGRERARIEQSWDGSVTRRAREKLTCLWRTPADAWTEICATPEPADLSRRDAAARVFETAHRAADEPAAEPTGARECED